MPDHVSETQKWNDRCDVHIHERRISTGRAAENARTMHLLADRLFDCAARGEMHTPPCQSLFSEYQKMWKKVYRAVHK